MKTLLLINVFITLYVLNNNAQYYYVRSDATGNNDGSDWENAYTTLPAELERGATYYIADGIFESYTFDDAEVGSQYITIKKAIESDHGSDVGWQASYGDGQVVFDRIRFMTSFWIIDGSSRADWDTGYGIYIHPLVRTGNFDDKAIFIANANLHDIILRYIDIERDGYIEEDSGDGGIYGPADDCLVQYCYIHDFMGNGITLHGENNLVEYTKIAKTHGYGGSHSQAIQLFSNSIVNMTIRYNIFQDISGTAAIALAWGTDGINIYGNIFYNSPGSSAYTSPATIHELSQPDETGVINARIYNNLFYRYDHTANGGHAGVVISYTSDPSTNLIYNNLFVGCEEVALDGNNAIHDHNYLINSTWSWNVVPGVNDSVHTGSDPIVDADNGDFTLVAGALAINAGLDLTTLPGFNPNPVDPDQNIRGADGFWDIGAYEYTTGTNILSASKENKESFRIYPNPIIYTATIEYTLSVDSDVEITLYDLAGRKIKNLYTGYQSAGIHTLNMNTGGLSKGIYSLRIFKTGNQTNSCILLINR